MTSAEYYLHGAEGVFGSWGNGGVKRFFHNDHLGSPRLITGDDGANPVATLAPRHDYPFGTDFGDGSPHDDRISKFTNHERDIPRRTDHMQARIYATSLQRFLSPDPGRDGWNLYSYVGNNPVNAVDPDSRNAAADCSAAACLVAVRAQVEVDISNSREVETAQQFKLYSDPLECEGSALMKSDTSWVWPMNTRKMKPFSLTHTWRAHAQGQPVKVVRSANAGERRPRGLV